MLGQVLRCDWVAATLSMGFAITTILFMQWGGVTKSWGDGSVIACIVLTPVLIVAFFLWEWYMGDSAMFRLSLIVRRNIYGSCGVLFNVFAIFMLEVYWLSIGFQAVYDTSPTGAGVKLLPFILVQVATLIVSSRVIPRIGRLKPVIALGPLFCILGAGLLYSVKYGTPVRNILGFEVLIGIGIGMCLQNTMLAAQFELKREPWLISIGTGMVVFIGFYGRIIGISVATCILENVLQKKLHHYAPDMPAQYVTQIINQASAVWTTVPPQYREPALRAYTDVLRIVYILGLPFGVLAFIFALCLTNEKMQTKQQEQDGIKASQEAQKKLADAESGAGATPAAPAVADAEIGNKEQV